MSKIEVDAIDKQSGSTLTLGGSGTAVTLASGATQTGFGREGSVDWQTGSIKTATFTAVNGQGFFCNTTAGIFTVNLPSSPSVGNIVAVSDYAQTFATNNLTIGRGGSNIEGSASDIVLDATGLAMTFVYVDGTKGWKVVGAGREADKTAAEFIEATGGTITEDGNFKVHTFTGPGTFTVCAAGNASGSNTIDYLVVAGGSGGGAGNTTSVHGGGGGGAGGLRYSATTYTNPAPGPSAGTALPVSAQAYPIAVGGGGSGAATGSGPCNGNTGNSGVNSVFSTITSAGGGGGGTRQGSGGQNSGAAGGAGGGSTTAGGAGGAGNTPPVSPPQGNNGGANSCQPVANMGGGGGAGAVGVSGSCSASGAGGAGLRVDINGSPVTYAGGGGGGSSASPQTINTAAAGGAGGGGGGGNSPSDPGSAGSAGTTNTGGGGGGSGAKASGGNGGSGIVIIRYKFQ
jgi:hypothetical protein